MSSHHAYQMYAHITWHTWKRIGCVDMGAAEDVRNAVASASRATGVRVLRNAVLADHVHLVVSFRPDIRLSDFVRLAKVSGRDPCQSAGPRCRALGAGLLRDHHSQARPSSGDAIRRRSVPTPSGLNPQEVGA